MPLPYPAEGVTKPGTMGAPRKSQARSAARKAQIVHAALKCFSEIGYERTTMADIRSASGASIGSLYHHYASKEKLAVQVYLEGIERYQVGFVAALERHEDARCGIFAVVRYHLEWVGEHPLWAQYLFSRRREPFMAALEPPLVERNMAFFDRVSQWFAPHLASGEIRRLPRDIYPALLLGPAQEYVRWHFAGHTRTPIAEAAELFGEAAWRAFASKGG